MHQTHQNNIENIKRKLKTQSLPPSWVKMSDDIGADTPL